jgi:hypothetical protein
MDIADNGLLVGPLVCQISRALLDSLVVEEKTIRRFLFKRTGISGGNQERKGDVVEATLHGHGVHRFHHPSETVKIR